MKGTRRPDGVTIWENGSATGGGRSDPPGTWPYPPPGGGTPIEVQEETPGQSGPINPGPFPPPIAESRIKIVQGSVQQDGSTVWEDGSRTYLPHKGQVTHPPDPPGSWAWPQPGVPTQKIVPLEQVGTPVVLSTPPVPSVSEPAEAPAAPGPTPAPPAPASATLEDVQGWWRGLSPRGKAATAAAALLGGGLIIRGISK